MIESACLHRKIKLRARKSLGSPIITLIRILQLDLNASPLRHAQAVLLVVNGFAVLNEERFLAKVRASRLHIIQPLQSFCIAKALVLSLRHLSMMELPFCSQVGLNLQMSLEDSFVSQPRSELRTQLAGFINATQYLRCGI